MGSCVFKEDGSYLQIRNDLHDGKSASARPLPLQSPRYHTTSGHQSALIGIVKSFIHWIQNILHCHPKIDHSFLTIPNSVTTLILQYLRDFTFYHVFGIGKYITSDGEMKTFQRLHHIERRLLSPLQNGLFRGHNKYFIRSFSEIYGVGNNAFESLCHEHDDEDPSSSAPNPEHYALHRLNACYQYLDFMDQDQSIELMSDSRWSNDVILKWNNGSLYISSLCMNGKGRWQRVFAKPKFDDLNHNGLLSIVAIECGLLHSMLLANNGTVYCLGANAAGQCGVGQCSEREDSVRLVTSFIVKEVHIESISAGKYHCCAMDSDNGLWCWGLNEHGQCSVSKEISAVVEPTKVCLQTERMVKAECGESFTVFLDEYGLYSGFGVMIVSTLDFANIKSWDNCKEMVFTEMSCGSNHVLLIGDDGKLYSHGSNEFHKSGLSSGRAAKPTVVRSELLPHDAPCTVFAGLNNSIVVYKLDD